jgi:chromatin segregation and condensation protein Rec8/ScpA/Scc1 (kleisin family)
MPSRLENLRKNFGDIKRRHSLDQKNLSEVFHRYRIFYKESRPFRQVSVIKEPLVIEELSKETAERLSEIITKVALEQPISNKERAFRRNYLSEISIFPVPEIPPLVER